MRMPHGDGPVQGAVKGYGQDAAGDRDDRGHRGDVADGGQGGRHRACPAECRAGEGDETAGGRLRENCASVLPSEAMAAAAAAMASGEAGPAVVAISPKPDEKLIAGPCWTSPLPRCP